MTPVVIDASVWVAAADCADTLSGSSRAFLRAVMRLAQPIVLPAMTRLEVACALSRRLRNGERGVALADDLLQSRLITERDLDPLLERAITLGTASCLRAGDAFYAAAAAERSALIISWDQELIRRANAMTPEAWLAERARSVNDLEAPR